MNCELGRNTLIIFPCCAEKQSGGARWDNSHHDAVSSIVSETTFRRVVEARRQVLELLRADERFVSHKYRKNTHIKLGPDFGLTDSAGLYLRAIERYNGHLYSATPHFSRLLGEHLTGSNPPKVLILSALYGPLHPFDLIQDYNLKMSDSPAFRTWKSHFPRFMQEYVSETGIREVFLYFGSSTAYLKVARIALEPLRSILDRAVRFDVIDGIAYHTPHNHGLLITEHLGLARAARYTRRIVPKLLW